MFCQMHTAHAHILHGVADGKEQCLGDGESPAFSSLRHVALVPQARPLDVAGRGLGPPRCLRFKPVLNGVEDATRNKGHRD